MYLTVTESLGDFLRYQREFHNAPDLLDRWSPAMETQLNVRTDIGQPVEDKQGIYSDKDFEWFNIRIPKNAESEPYFKDYPLKFPLSEYAEGIGSTGWDWKERQSRWFGYDFDAITGHAAGVGIGHEELAIVANKAQALPYVEVRKSTGGMGLHLYVFCDGIPTANHTEHAALARCVLGMMSSEVDFDFASQIDACGGNLWLWHKKMTNENEGLKLLKPATKVLSESDLPSNWRDHAEVITRKRSKLRIAGITSEAQAAFDDLVSSRHRVPLDDRHKALRDVLRQRGHCADWVPDHHLLQTHTVALRELMEDEKIRDELKLAGVFQTNSLGSEPDEANCFMFPLPNGGWKVVRFSMGIAEADTWTQDGQGWTTCSFNRIPDLAVAAKAKGGVERVNNGGFVFESAKSALAVVEMLGQSLELPEKYSHREAILRKNKDGRVIVDLPRESGDTDMKGWGTNPKKDRWQRLLNVKAEQPADACSFSEWDRLVRHLKTPAGMEAGFMLRDRTTEWGHKSKSNIISALMSLDNSKPEAEAIVGGAVLNPWKLVSLPFQPEFLAGRQWNLDSPQLAFEPSKTAQPHPHWDMVFNHIGASLDGPLGKLKSEDTDQIKTGADYLRAFYAVMLREPLERTPYLFLHGPENSGKSILWEAFTLLVTRGVVKADRVFSSQSEFNGELVGCILAVLEERNIANTKGALGRLKDYTAGLTMSIRKMYQTSFDIPNTTHWIQCANPDPETGDYACPVFPGDTRITAIYVPPLGDKEIPKSVLMQRLREEGPALLRTLYDMKLPKFQGRLRIPVVESEDKRMLQESNAPLLSFVDECLATDPTAKVAKADVYARYEQWAESGGDRPLEFPEFGKKLKALTNIRDGKINVGDRRKNAYLGIRLAPDTTLAV